jgi:hypothetical protein
MNAFTFIFECLKPLINCDDFNQISQCKLCQRNDIFVSINTNKTRVCSVCSLLLTPNKSYFGMLTKVRAHSAVSFLNSLLVIDEIHGITLVVSEKYAQQSKSIRYIEFVVYDVHRYIINLLNNPCKRVVIKPSIRFEEFAENLMLSDEKSLYITTSKGGYCINIDTWNRLVSLIKTNDKGVVALAISYLQKIATGDLLNTDVILREFVAKNHILMIRFNDLLCMDIHSRLFILNLLKLVCDDAI